MAAAYTKEFLTGRADGLPIDVIETSSPGDTIHTAHATAKDEIHLYASNHSTGDVLLTVEFGGVTAKEQIVVKLKKEKGLVFVAIGVLSNTKIVKAFSDSANDVSIIGFVNRIT